MAYDKVIDSATLDAGMVATANAIREKTGQAGAIPWENDKGFSAAVAGIQVGGGSGGGTMESGELTLTSANFYTITIPVSSKKSHVIVYAKNLSELIVDPNISPAVARRISFLYGAEGVGLIENGIQAKYIANIGMATGDCYMYDASEQAEGKAIFNADSINIKVSYSSMNIGDFCWVAW